MTTPPSAGHPDHQPDLQEAQHGQGHRVDHHLGRRLRHRAGRSAGLASVSGGERLHYWVFGGALDLRVRARLRAGCRMPTRRSIEPARREHRRRASSAAGCTTLPGRGWAQPVPRDARRADPPAARTSPDPANGFTLPSTASPRRWPAARDDAGDRDVSIAGGADVIRQALDAGEVDALVVPVAPVVLSGGKRPFEGFTRDLDLEIRSVHHSRVRRPHDVRRAPVAVPAHDPADGVLAGPSVRDPPEVAPASGRRLVDPPHVAVGLRGGVLDPLPATPRVLVGAVGPAPALLHHVEADRVVVAVQAPLVLAVGRHVRAVGPLLALGVAAADGDRQAADALAKMIPASASAVAVTEALTSIVLVLE